MLGTIVNCIAIIIGSLIGLLLKGGIPSKISKTIMNGLALCVLYIGISGAMKGTEVLLVIVSIATGAFIGEIIDIDKWLNKLGSYIESKLKRQEGSVAQGFVSASLLFCVGAMAVVGSLESGLQGNHSTLYAKSMLDGISSIIFTSSLGIGVIFSAIVVLIYQGAITLGAVFLSGILSNVVVANMTAIGSLLIIGLAFNMLDITKIKVANLLPAILMPILFGVFGIL